MMLSTLLRLIARRMGQGLFMVEHRAEIAHERKPPRSECGRTESPAAFDYCYYLSIFIEW